MCGINGADPGAVPGASTRQHYGGEIGSTHTVKAHSFIRHCIRRYRADFINAKNQKARRVAANINTAIVAGAKLAA